MTSDLREAKRFLSDLRGEGDTAVLAAVSGGLDSMCLLHLLSDWGRRNGLTVTAAHFNHRLRPGAGGDEAFVSAWCAERGIPFVSGSGDVRAAAAQTGRSIEEAARDLRYAFLQEEKEKNRCAFILTAHHADDHAETVLLNLLRGTGARGLAGIPRERDGICRPFLQVSRRELEDYARRHGVAHVEDETNAEDGASRNVLRHRVMPVLRELNFAAAENIARTAALLAEDDAALEALAEELLEKARIEPGQAAFLPEQAWQEAANAVVRRALRRMMILVGGRQKDLSAAHAAALTELLRGSCGQEISLPYGMVGRREADGLLVCLRERAEAAELLPGRPVRWGAYTLTLLETAAGEGLRLREGGALTVGCCVPGDRLRLQGARGSRTVKRLCVDRKIPLAERERLPAIFADGRTAAVWQLGIDEKFVPEAGERFRFIQILKDKEEKTL